MLELPPDRANQWTAVPAPVLQPGALLDDWFEIGELLGEGGTSLVYAGKERPLHRHAAIKILKAKDDDTRRRFIDEARILANLRHPHLVQVRALGETDSGAPYMVLELLPGESLEDRLRERGPLAWREVVEIAAQVASALGALHQASVIHRDLKPGNLVCLEGATGRPLVKLIDLGIAKVESWARVEGEGFTPSPRRPTEARMVVGTPGFHAPEAGLAPPGPAFDTFALGVTIHLLCTGEMPNLVARRPMSEVRPGAAFPPELEALVVDATAVLAEDRIATAAEFQRRLAAILAAHAGGATPHLFDGCYELLEVVGNGAKAEVYRAYHRDTGDYVALKIMSERSSRDPEERRRFVREALALRGTCDPALPSLIEARTGPDREKPFIAMTLAPGRTASKFWVGDERLEASEILEVGRQIAGALLSLHARGILHRDVHGGNVLVDVGERTTATLLDVGMAHFEDAYYARAQLRYLTPPEARVPLGTGGLERLEWTAPEARASRQWTAKCDVYSLGLLLYKLLTSKSPYKNGALVSPRKFVPDCPRSLESALLAALEGDPKKRLEMKDLRDRLDVAAAELRGDEPEPTRARTPPHPPRWARYLAAAALGGLVTLGLAQLLAPRAPAHAVTQAASVRAADHDVDEVKPPTRTHAAARGPGAADLTTRPPRVREALADAHAALRGCAARTGKLLMVEFTTKADGDRFASVAVSGLADPDLTGCVREATATIRFQPEAAQTFTEEYEP
jgi:serine/threonine protein kinase